MGVLRRRASHSFFLLQALNRNQSVKARWRGRWGTLPGGFFCKPERAAPSPGRPGYSGYMAVTWRLHAGRGISWKQTKRSMEQMGVTDCSICRICGETLKPPPPFSSSERTTNKKKCNTVTTFGKRRKSKRYGVTFCVTLFSKSVTARAKL